MLLDIGLVPINTEIKHSFEYYITVTFKKIKNNLDIFKIASFYFASNLFDFFHFILFPLKTGDGKNKEKPNYNGFTVLNSS